MKYFVNYFSSGKVVCDKEAKVAFVEFLPEAGGLVACEEHAREYVSSLIRRRQKAERKFSERLMSDLEDAISKSKEEQ